MTSPPKLVDTSLHTFFAPCPRGLEDLLREELLALGGQDVAATQGGVAFTGPFELCYRANLESRLASRVLWQIARGPYETEQDLYDAAYRLAWPEWFAAGCSIKVKVSARRCPLTSLDFVTLRTKDAVCDKFSALTKSRPNVDTRQPDIRIDLFLDPAGFILYLDTSGEALFKRGWRRAGGEAPLRENLAAGMLRLSGWTPDQTLYDPLCGGGTILLEAALMARGISPGLGRRFAFEKLRNFDAAAWRGQCEASRNRQTRTAPMTIYGSDKDGLALKAARAQLEAAGVAESVRLTQTDVFEAEPPAQEGILVTNPPYGRRMGDPGELADFYPRFGDVLKQRFPGWRAHILTADLRLPKLIGLQPSRRIPLFNGALECRLFEFKLVRGQMRRKPRAKDPGSADSV
jgi:putative N6-adenine-specific DNA methylase